jgi:hypothetical protein
MRKTNLLFIVFIVLFISCVNKKSKKSNLPQHINLDELKSVRDLPLLSDFTVNTEFIKLERDSHNLVGRINGLNYTEDFLFVASSHNLLIFERKTGRFIRKIGTRGKGPAEYQSFRAFEIDELNKHIYMWDYFKKQFIIYGIDGDFISAFRIEGLDNDYPEKFKLLDDKRIVVYNNNDMGNGDNSMFLLDMNGKIIDSLLNKHQFKVVFPLSLARNLNNHLKKGYSNEVSFKYKYSDTLYHIHIGDKLELTPAYIFSTKEKVKHKYSDREYAFLTGLNETGEYFFFNHGSYFFMYDKIEEELYATANKKRKGIENDIDGGLPFWPKYAQDNTLASYYDALELKENLTLEHFEQTFAKNPKQKEELEELVNSLRIDDNPVIMIVTLK